MAEQRTPHSVTSLVAPPAIANAALHPGSSVPSLREFSVSAPTHQLSSRLPAAGGTGAARSSLSRRLSARRASQSRDRATPLSRDSHSVLRTSLFKLRFSNFSLVAPGTESVPGSCFSLASLLEVYWPSFSPLVGVTASCSAGRVREPCGFSLASYLPLYMPAFSPAFPSTNRRPDFPPVHPEPQRRRVPPGPQHSKQASDRPAHPPAPLYRAFHGKTGLYATDDASPVNQAAGSGPASGWAASWASGSTRGENRKRTKASAAQIATRIPLFQVLVEPICITARIFQTP